ncbi:MAG: AmmeMemoRadiSam system protein B [Bacteroidetes bacterium]|nr:AmmeMemoRadiSam system protein B [Bacteroidota bacterium]
MQSNETLTFKLRKPAVAGMFYPSDAQQLRKEVELLLENATSTHGAGSIGAVVAPHAGYVYSGYVAAEAYRLILNQSYDTVVVISPSHRDYFSGISLYPGDYETPLGVVELDRDMARDLLAAGGPIKASELGHRQEHGVEVELPFLQVALGDFRFVPLVMGTQDEPSSFGLGQILSDVCSSRKVLLVASSDLSHFYPLRAANKLDLQVVEDVEAYDARRFFEHVKQRRCEACGYGTIIAAILGSRGAGCEASRVLSYHTSGEISGDYEEVVGYMSAIFYAKA